MRPSILLFAAMVLMTGAQARSADCTPPPDYKRKIEALLSATYPQYGEFYCNYYEPKRVLVGEAKKEMCAVRCDWGAKLKSGALLAQINQSIFTFDGDRITKPGRDEKIEWIDGEPMLERKKPNHPSGPTPAAVTRPAGLAARQT
jgi:hypothetical protein